MVGGAASLVARALQDDGQYVIGSMRSGQTIASPPREPTASPQLCRTHSFQRRYRQPGNVHDQQESLRSHWQDGIDHRRIARPWPADGRGAGRLRRAGWCCPRASRKNCNRPRRTCRHRGSTRTGLPPMARRTADIERLADAAIEKLGHVDILINNAGASWGAPAEDYPAEAWDKVFDLNIRGLFLLTQQIGKRSMIPRKYGRIINIASIAGLARQSAGRHADHRLQHQQGRAGELHPHPGGRVGQVRDHRERAGPGLLSDRRCRTC